jgi:Cu(I)/Ag(I) efflux system membrane protein CusA/SilA
MLRGSVLFNVRDRDLEYSEAQDKLNAMMTKMPKGYYMEWSGQWKTKFEQQNIELDCPWLYIIIFMILYFTYNPRLVTIITVPLR